MTFINYKSCSVV